MTIIPRKLLNYSTPDIKIILALSSVLCYEIVQQKYNYKTGQREFLHNKEDLSIYVSGTDPKNEVELKIPINRIELNYFKRLETEKEKNNFIKRIAKRVSIVSLFTDEERDILWPNEPIAQFTSCITYKGITITRDMKLSMDETTEYRLLPDKRQKKEYIDKLIIKKGITKALHEEVFKRWPNDFKKDS